MLLSAKAKLQLPTFLTTENATIRAQGRIKGAEAIRSKKLVSCWKSPNVHPYHAVEKQISGVYRLATKTTIGTTMTPAHLRRTLSVNAIQQLNMSVGLASIALHGINGSVGNDHNQVVIAAQPRALRLTLPSLQQFDSSSVFVSFSRRNHAPRYTKVSRVHSS